MRTNSPTIVALQSAFILSHGIIPCFEGENNGIIPSFEDKNNGIIPVFECCLCRKSPQSLCKRLKSVGLWGGKTYASFARMLSPTRSESAGSYMASEGSWAARRRICVKCAPSNGNRLAFHGNATSGICSISPCVTTKLSLISTCKASKGLGCYSCYSITVKK